MLNLFSSSVVVTARQFFGAPIVCDAGSVSLDPFNLLDLDL